MEVVPGMDETVSGSLSQSKSGRATAADPFTVSPTLESDAQVRAALDVWAGACLELSLPDLAVDMLDTANGGRRSGDSNETTFRRAVYLLEANRFTEALAALPSQYRELPDEPSEVHLGHLVQATADAALGLDAALTWLTSLAAPLLHSDAAEFYAVCLTRVGDARGDRSLADAAYRQLGHLGFLDRRTTPRSAALLMLGRDQSDVDAAQQTLNDTLEMVRACSQSVVTDPQPLLDTAAELVDRGDRGGAALLLKWATRLDPHGRRVKEAYLPLSPRKVGLRRGLVLTILWLAAAVVAGYGIWNSTPAALLPLAAAAMLWHRYVSLPGMSLVDSRLYRRIRPLQADPVTPQETLRYSVIGVVTVAFCAIGAVVALAAIGSRLGVAWDALPLWMDILVWTVAMGVVPALVTLALWRLRRRRMAREADQRTLAVQRDLVAASGRCRCWNTAVLLGSDIAGYLAHHLHPLDLPAMMAGLNQAHPDRELRTAYCSRTGAAWLRITVSPEGAAYLLRGPLGLDSSRSHDGEGAEPATGFYL
jgi:hypothetical protein